MSIANRLTGFAALLLCSAPAAAEGGAGPIDLTTHWVGYLCLAIFVVAYVAVMVEEHIHLRKSKPVMVAAGVIWALVAAVYAAQGDTHTAHEAVRANLLGYGELFLFLLAAMTYINTMEERGIFIGIRVWMVSRGFSLRAIYWLTGLLAFFISPVADNLTTALVMSTVVMTIARDKPKFVVVACINIVVAANAGGAFSPFGDITTLMVWQAGIVRFEEFFILFIPSVVNWLVPAVAMSFAVPLERPRAMEEQFALRHGAFVVVGLFVLTIALAVCGHNFLHLPPVLGMMTGLGLLKLYGYYLTHRDLRLISAEKMVARGALPADFGSEQLAANGMQRQPFNIFVSMKRAEWDTLMFFYGVILCVGGLGLIGYLELVSNGLYVGLGPTTANVLIGILSAIVDNIPLMFAVLTMDPDMSHGQWLLITLTCGVGGSLLSIGSAAGVGVMGQARGIYTFFAHLKWAWAIALGYAASIWVHLWLNTESFSVVTPH
ncbi:MAG TPA: sodium:proton antiporter NhaD [Gammaproteobacteria bacterium]|jgi:Na+/H+ antiporter NhaD/arsenite permease-like protein